MPENQVVIGIGASAGGLEALEQLVAGMPAPLEKHASLIVAQHLSPNYKSLLSHILSKKSTFPVIEAENAQEIMPGMVYVAPADCDIQVTGGKITLTRPLPTQVPKPSVDLLFTSLANTYGKNAIAIILSGTGTDGAKGVQTVKAKGGMVIVQKPDTARYDGMPMAALQTGQADFVLAPEQIGEHIRHSMLDIEEDAPAQQHTALDDLYDLLLEKFNTDFSLHKPKSLLRKIEKRMTINHITDLAAYVEFLKKHADEPEELFHSLLINVTSFFRDPDMFRQLEEILLPKISELSPQDHFRIWVAGCATGEEAYSLAMLLQYRLEQTFSHAPMLQVFATDIDEDALQIARRGVYSEQQVQAIPEHLRAKYLTPLERGFEIHKKLRAKVLFSKHDLTADPPFLKIDLLSCRNLLIYFNKTAQKRVFPLFYHALKEDGILFLGKSESTAQLEDIFTTVTANLKIFRKQKNIAPDVSLRYKAFGVAENIIKKAEKPREENYRNRLLETFSALTGHAVLIVNAAQQILETRGDISGLLQIPDGALNFSINNLVSSEISTEIKSVMIRLTKNNQLVRLPLKKIVLNGQKYYVRIQGSPLAASNDNSGPYMIVIEKFAPDDLFLPAVDPEAAEQNIHILELEQDLAATKQNLQTYIEEVETANEELQSLNEELQASNEELQSANEELQTGNEELQSANEELETAYSEIKKVHEELIEKEESEKHANVLFKTLFTNTQQGNILLSESWDIRLMNPRAEELLLKTGIHPKTGKRNLITLLPADWQQQLLPLLQQARQTHQTTTVTFAVSSGETNYYYEFFINPIPATSNNNGQEIALGIIDRTEEKIREAEIFRRDELLASLIDSDTTFVVRIDLKGRYTYANRAFCKKFGYKREEIIGRHYNFTIHPDDYATCESEVARLFTMPEGAVIGFEMRKPGPNGEYLFTEWEFVLIKTPSGEVTEIQGVGRDITEKKLTQLALEEERSQLEMMIWGGRLGTWDWHLSTGRIRFNERWAEILGYRMEEVHFDFEQWQQLIHPDDRVRVIQAIDDCIRGNTAFYEVEHRKKAKSGDWKWLIATGKVVERDKKGKALRLIGIHQDITDKKRMEEIMRLSEERNDAVLRTMQEGIVLQDMTGAIISCNHSAEEILGMTFDQMIGRTSVDPKWRAIREDGSHFPGDEHPAMITIRTGQPQTNVLMGVHKPSGEVSWISINSQLLRHPDTQVPYAVFAMFHDITHRKNAELALASAHKRFESIVDSTDGIVWEVDYQTFRFTYVSKQAERLLGYGLEEWHEPDFWSKHIHPEDREKTVAYCVSCSDKLQAHEFEYRFISKDGRIVWLRDIVSVVASESRPTLLRGIMIDITKRKEMEQMLERLSLVAQRTSNSVIITDKKRRIIWVNEAFTGITGYTLKEVLGKTPKMLQFEETDPATITYISENLNQQQPVHCEILNRGKHGNVYWLEIEIQPLFDTNRELTGFMAVQTDITERKKAEEQIKKQNETLKDIAFTQSHILRRPLANILGLLNLIDMEKDRQQINALYEYFDYLLQSAREADEIIHQIVEKTNEMEE